MAMASPTCWCGAPVREHQQRDRAGVSPGQRWCSMVRLGLVRQRCFPMCRRSRSSESPSRVQMGGARQPWSDGGSVRERSPAPGSHTSGRRANRPAALAAGRRAESVSTCARPNNPSVAGPIRGVRAKTRSPGAPLRQFRRHASQRNRGSGFTTTGSRTRLEHRKVADRVGVEHALCRDPPGERAPTLRPPPRLRPRRTAGAGNRP